MIIILIIIIITEKTCHRIFGEVKFHWNSNVREHKIITYNNTNFTNGHNNDKNGEIKFSKTLFNITHKNSTLQAQIVLVATTGPWIPFVKFYGAHLREEK